jgi:hypothetical protein
MAIDGALLPIAKRGGGAPQCHCCWSNQKHAESEGFGKLFFLRGGGRQCSLQCTF